MPDGTLLYERMPAGEAGTRLLASGEQEAALSEGRRVHVYVWSRAIQRNELSADLQKKALRGLSGLEYRRIHGSGGLDVSADALSNCAAPQNHAPLL